MRAVRAVPPCAKRTRWRCRRHGLNLELSGASPTRSICGTRRGRAKARPRDTARMKLQATIVISYRADSLGDAGDALDDVLQRAR